MMATRELQRVTIANYEDLYRRIPVFECIPGCHECCGPIGMGRSEWEAIQDKRAAISLDCPYICDTGCAIYDQRPLICRLYGTVKRMRCPHGCGPVLMLSTEIEGQILGAYRDLMEGDYPKGTTGRR